MKVFQPSKDLNSVYTKIPIYCGLVPFSTLRDFRRNWYQPLQLAVIGTKVFGLPRIFAMPCNRLLAHQRLGQEWKTCPVCI